MKTKIATAFILGGLLGLTVPLLVMSRCFSLINGNTIEIIDFPSWAQTVKCEYKNMTVYLTPLGCMIDNAANGDKVKFYNDVLARAHATSERNSEKPDHGSGKIED